MPASTASRARPVIVRNVSLTRTIAPFGRVARYPQGACSKSSSALSSAMDVIAGQLTRGAVAGATRQERLHRRDRAGRIAQMRTMAGSGELHESAAGDLLAHVASDLFRSDGILGALQDQARDAHACEVGAIVGEESDAREVPGDLRIGAAETVLELRAELRPLGVLHDDRSHRARPAEMIGVQEVQQAIDVRTGESAHVLVVDSRSRATGRSSPMTRSAQGPSEPRARRSWR